MLRWINAFVFALSLCLPACGAGWTPGAWPAYGHSPREQINGVFNVYVTRDGSAFVPDITVTNPLAQDVWQMECYNAAYERNLWLPDGAVNLYFPDFYRDELDNFKNLKNWAAGAAPYFIPTATIDTNGVVTPYANYDAWFSTGGSATNWAYQNEFPSWNMLTVLMINGLATNYLTASNTVRNQNDYYSPSPATPADLTGWDGLKMILTNLIYLPGTNTSWYVNQLGLHGSDVNCVPITTVKSASTDFDCGEVCISTSCPFATPSDAAPVYGDGADCFYDIDNATFRISLPGEPLGCGLMGPGYGAVWCAADHSGYDALSNANFTLKFAMRWVPTTNDVESGGEYDTWHFALNPYSDFNMSYSLSETNWIQYTVHAYVEAPIETFSFWTLSSNYRTTTNCAVYTNCAIPTNCVIWTNCVVVSNIQSRVFEMDDLSIRWVRSEVNCTSNTGITCEGLIDCDSLIARATVSPLSYPMTNSEFIGNVGFGLRYIMGAIQFITNEWADADSACGTKARYDITRYGRKGQALLGPLTQSQQEFYDADRTVKLHIYVAGSGDAITIMPSSLVAYLPAYPTNIPYCLWQEEDASQYAAPPWEDTYFIGSTWYNAYYDFNGVSADYTDPSWWCCGGGNPCGDEHYDFFVPNSCSCTSPIPDYYEMGTWAFLRDFHAACLCYNPDENGWTVEIEEPKMPLIQVEPAFVYK